MRRLVRETTLAQGSCRLIRERWAAFVLQLEMARKIVSGFPRDRRMRVKAHARKIVRIGDMSFSACEKQVAFPFHFFSRFLGSEFLRQSLKEDILDDLCFTRFFETGPRSHLLADSTAGWFAALVQVLHRRSRYWSITNPRASRFWDSKEFARFSHQLGVKKTDPCQTDEGSEMVVLTNAPWLSEVDARHNFSLPESQSFWADVFAAWVTTEWLQIAQGEEFVKQGRYGNALVRQRLVQAPPGDKDESVPRNSSLQQL